MSEGVPSVSRISAVFGGSVGNLVEWFDWYTYSAAALYFAPIFFPKGDQTAQLLQTAAVFAVGFFARPIGAWLMGRYADRVGRKAALTLSVAMMCGGSLAIAATPGAATIGIAAPVILLLARIFQGLSLGGEYGASATYISEMAGRRYRGFWSSFQYVTLIGGQLMALAVLIILQHLLRKEDMAAWGWRIPFVIGAGLAIVAYWMRRRLQESQSFVRAEAAGSVRGGMRQLFFEHPREALTVLGFTAGGSMIFYVYTTYMQKFLTNTAGFSKDQATEISAVTLIAFMIAQPVFGWLSDKVGRKPMMLVAFGGGTLITWPVMTAASIMLHLDQRGGESRTLSHRHSHSRRSGTLCPRQCGVRRHGRVCRAMVQIDRNRERILCIRLRAVGDQFFSGIDHARHPRAQPHHRGLMQLSDELSRP